MSTPKLLIPIIGRKSVRFHPLLSRSFSDESAVVSEKSPVVRRYRQLPGPYGGTMHEFTNYTFAQVTQQLPQTQNPIPIPTPTPTPTPTPIATVEPTDSIPTPQSSLMEILKYKLRFDMTKFLVNLAAIKATQGIISYGSDSDSDDDD